MIFDEKNVVFVYKIKGKGHSINQFKIEMVKIIDRLLLESVLIFLQQQILIDKLVSQNLIGSKEIKKNKE